MKQLNLVIHSYINSPIELLSLGPRTHGGIQALVLCVQAHANKNVLINKQLLRIKHDISMETAIFRIIMSKK